MPNPSEEFQRLTRRYRELGDAELIELARQMDDLTSIAERVLSSELGIRRVKIPADTPPDMSVPQPARPEQIGRFASLSARDCIFEFAENEDAQAAAEMLAEAGIVCDVVLPSMEKLDMGAPRLAVFPGDVQAARNLLSRPIPEEFRLLVRTRDAFVPPVCPKCGSVDPLLESIEPTNQWRCEVCETVWTDRSSNAD